MAYSCRGLEFTLRDSASARRFVRAHPAQLPKKSALQATVCRDALMNWCEERGVDYLFGLARNARRAPESLSASTYCGRVSARDWCLSRRGLLGLSVAHDLSALVARKLSALEGSAGRPDEADGMAAGDEDVEVREGD